MSTGGYCQHCNSIFQSVRERREHSCEGLEKVRQEFASIFPVRTPMPFMRTTNRDRRAGMSNERDSAADKSTPMGS